METEKQSDGGQAYATIVTKERYSGNSIWKRIELARKVLAVKTAIVVAVLLVLSFAPSPDALAGQQNKSLGDAAREQRRVKKKAARQKYTNEDFVTTTAEPAGRTNVSEPSAPASDAIATTSDDERKETGTSYRVLRSSKPLADKDEVVVVPAGTQIIVEFTQPIGLSNAIGGKVTVPVRVGWTTAIPAGSKVKLRTNVSVVELRAITIRGVEYKVKTNAMPLFTAAPGSDSEVGFALTEAFEIPR